MLTMDQVHHIRALYYEQGYNISEIAEITGRDWKTVAKYIDMADFNEPPWIFRCAESANPENRKSPVRSKEIIILLISSAAKPLA